MAKKIHPTHFPVPEMPWKKEDKMFCPKCNSTDTGYQHYPITKRKGRSLLWWVYFVLIGWILELAMWLFLFIPMLIIRVVRSGQTTTKLEKFGICRECGHFWRIRSKSQIARAVFSTAAKIALVLFVVLFYMANIQ